jgi:hypothetical protein
MHYAGQTTKNIQKENFEKQHGKRKANDQCGMLASDAD